MPKFWRNWLTGWCGAVALFGLVLTGAAFAATSGPTRLLFALLNGPSPLDLDAQMRFTLAVLGAVTFGWSLTLVAAIQAAHQLDQRGRPVWRQITLSVLAWFVVDSGLSVATGYGLNAIPNTIFVLGFLAPVIRSGVLRP
jgi:hypothetical protein